MIDVKEEPVFGRINYLMQLARDEDERGLVLSLAAFAEDFLGRLLVAYMREGKAAIDLVEGFNAPLGTFSARIKAGFALGLLTDEQHKDLELLRKVRNEFAHNWEGCSLEKQCIKDWITSMSNSRIDDRVADSLKEKLYATTSCTLIELEHLLGALGKRGRRVPMVATHLSRIPPKNAP